MTKPVYEADSKLIAPGESYGRQRLVSVNGMEGNPTYALAIITAKNHYACNDSCCFWHKTNSAVNGISQQGKPISFNASAGDLHITINPCGYEMESVRFLVYRDYQSV